jgi:hypothetical protein
VSFFDSFAANIQTYLASSCLLFLAFIATLLNMAWEYKEHAEKVREEERTMRITKTHFKRLEERSIAYEKSFRDGTSRQLDMSSILFSNKKSEQPQCHSFS